MFRTNGTSLKEMKAPTSLLRRVLLGSALATTLLTLRAHSQPQQKIRIVVGTNIIPVTLDDNASARDFAALLPLSLTLEDYAATEKVATLPRKLSICLLGRAGPARPRGCGYRRSPGRRPHGRPH